MMKVCPVCQASFAEGFVYCPHDAVLLARYDLRARVQETQLRECNFLLTTETFWQRLTRVSGAALADFARNPRAFLAALWRGEGSSQRRKQALQAGVALAVISYTAILTGFLLLGLSRAPLAPVVLAKTSEPRDALEVVPLILPVMPLSHSELTRGRNGHLGGSLAQPRRAQGGGSGGAQQPLPASGGVSARAQLAPQLLLPNPAPPVIERPSLPVVPTVIADPATLAYVKGPTGLAEAPPAPPSKGPGAGGGMGNQHGTGIGLKGDDAGFNSGSQFNTGGRTPQIGGDRTTGPGNQNGVRMANLRLRPTILYKEKAKYTEEARQQQVQGAVILLATFHANGQISEIRVIRGLPSGLTEEAIQSAKRIRFQPAVEHGVPVTVRAQLEFNFALY
jgi:TonB family protein